MTTKNSSKEEKTAKAKTKASPAMDKKGESSEAANPVDSKNNVRLSEADIFAAMSSKTEQFHALRSDIETCEKELIALKAQKEALESKIKPVRRMIKVFNPNGTAFISVSPTERKAIRFQIKTINNQLILKEDNLSRMKHEYSAYAESINEQMRKNELRNKAQSKHWTKRNKWSVGGRVIKTFNLLRAEQLGKLRDLAKLAISKKKDHKPDFDNALQSLLDEFDAETSILCSHELKSTMYNSIRNLLKEWDPKKAPEFKKLVFSENQ